MLLCVRSMIFVPPRSLNRNENPRFNSSVLVMPLGFCAGLKSSTRHSLCCGAHPTRAALQSTGSSGGFITCWYRGMCCSGAVSGMAITEQLSDTSSARCMVSFFCKTTARTQTAALHSGRCEEGSAPSGSLLSWAVRKQRGHFHKYKGQSHGWYLPPCTRCRSCNTAASWLVTDPVK